MGEPKFRYNEISFAIAEKIKNGIYKKGSLLPSEGQLSETYGANRGTIRKALSLLVSSGLVRKEVGIGTRVISNNAAAVVPEQTPVQHQALSFIMADDKNHNRRFTQPFYSELFSNLDKECAATGCQLIYFSPNNLESCVSHLQNERSSAVIFVSRTDESYIRTAQQMGLRTILVNDRMSNVTSITYDNLDGADAAIKELYRFGHRNIAVIAGPENYYSSKMKVTGCLKACLELGISLDPDNLFYGDWEFQSGYTLTKKLIHERSRSELPTALFCLNDMMAVGAMKALRELGFSVPGDISVMGFDNMDQLQYTEPTLSTVDTNKQLMAKLIVSSAMLPVTPSDYLGVHIVVPTSLLMRQSVDKPSR